MLYQYSDKKFEKKNEVNALKVWIVWRHDKNENLQIKKKCYSLSMGYNWNMNLFLKKIKFFILILYIIQRSLVFPKVWILGN